MSLSSRGRIALFRRLHAILVRMNTTALLPRNWPTSHSLLAAVLVSCANASTAQAQAPAESPPSVTPYRPSVSTPAALSAVGWLELEAGVLRATASGSERRDSLPYTLKLAFTPDWGFRIGGDAQVRQTDSAGQRTIGGGDSSIVLKRRFAVDDNSAFGLEAGATIPTARRGIGSGKSDYSVNAIYSADIGEYHTDLNFVSTRIGVVVTGVSRSQTLWAASLSKSLNETWGVVGEFSGTQQGGQDSTRQFLFATSFNVSKSLSLDAGASRSIRSGVPDRALFMGATLLVARLF